MTDQDSPQNTPNADDWDALARFVAGEGTTAERADMTRRLADEPALGELLGVLDRATSVPEPLPPTSLDVEAALASVLARREDRREATEPRRVPVVSLDAYRSRWRDARFRAAAAVLVVAGAGLLWKTFSPESATPIAVATAPSSFRTDVGAMDSLQLSDGTRVLLGPGSELALTDGYGGTGRELTLKGEARFDVVHDTARPFIVHTDAATFRDIGTVFAVHSDAGSGARVVVTEGAVSVQSRKQNATATVNAGDRATIGAEGELHVERAVTTTDDLAWTTGKLIFRDAPVAQVTEDIRRWYGLELRVDSGLPTQRLNVTFDRASAASVGSVVAAMLGGELRDEGGVLHITAKGTAVRPQ